ncbi:hypothetical protein B484DRAFT_358423, partial [Ochromonadaceae sp. CCMP2298]
SPPRSHTPPHGISHQSADAPAYSVSNTPTQPTPQCAAHKISHRLPHQTSLRESDAHTLAGAYEWWAYLSHPFITPPLSSFPCFLSCPSCLLVLSVPRLHLSEI